jgi:hypothetical protein
MSFYGERLERMGFSKYENGLPCLFVGLYFQSDYDQFMNHCGRRYIFWNGSDIIRAIQKQDWHKNISSSTVTHACHNDRAQARLASIGVNATIEPTLFANPERYKVSFTPSPTPHIYTRMARDREEEYGLYRTIEIAERLPNYTFHIYGDVDKCGPDNMVFHGKVEEEQMDSETDSMQGCLRSMPLGGRGQIGVKAILRGQYFVEEFDVDKAYTKLIEIKDKTEPTRETIPNLNVWINKLAGN